MPPPVLVLWDIDHTLIETGGIGVGLYQRAFQAATGQELLEFVTLSGRTELDIMTEMLETNGLAATDEVVAGLRGRLVAGYEATRDELGRVGRVLPGVREALASLAGDPAILQSVLTGNVEAVARLKIEAFGLAEHLDLDAGAYGDDHLDRADLVQVAQRRAAARTGVMFPSERTVLVGDTPNDVRAALHAGAHVLAVATGRSTEQQLRDAGAEYVVPDLRSANASKLITTITSGRS